MFPTITLAYSLLCWPQRKKIFLRLLSLCTILVLIHTAFNGKFSSGKDYLFPPFGKTSFALTLLNDAPDIAKDFALRFPESNTSKFFHLYEQERSEIGKSGALLWAHDGFLSKAGGRNTFADEGKKIIKYAIVNNPWDLMTTAIKRFIIFFSEPETNRALYRKPHQATKHTFYLGDVVKKNKQSNSSFQKIVPVKTYLWFYIVSLCSLVILMFISIMPNGRKWMKRNCIYSYYQLIFVACLLNGLFMSNTGGIDGRYQFRFSFLLLVLTLLVVNIPLVECKQNEINDKTHYKQTNAWTRNRIQFRRNEKNR